MGQPKLAHVVLQTGQPEVLTKWYCTVLRAHVVYAGHNLVFLTFDDEHHRIALMARGSETTAKSPTSAGMHHIAFTFDTLDDLLRRFEELSADGIRPVTPIQHGVTTSLYYRDPDGNHVELQIDNFADPDDATAYMHGPEYDAEPVGPPFDADLMAAARRTGTPVEQLITRAWALAGPPLPDPLSVLTS